MEKFLNLVTGNPLILILLLILGIITLVIIAIILLRGGVIKIKGVEIFGGISSHKKKERDIEKILQNKSKKVDDIIKANFDEISKISAKFSEENKKMQEGALKRALLSITLKYTEKIANEENNETKAKLLELYLKKDLNLLMTEKLDAIRKTNENRTIPKEEILSNISKYTEDIIMGMKEAAWNFDLIDQRTELVSLMEESKSIIRDNLEETIKQFISLSENEQKEKLVSIKNRQEQIQQELLSLLED